MNNANILLAYEDFGEDFFYKLIRVCTFFFFEVEISSHTLIPLFRPGLLHSGSASWDDCDWVFPDDLHVSLFPDRFQHYAWTVALSAHSDLVRSKVYACLGVTCHLHFWQNDQGILNQTGSISKWSCCQKSNTPSPHSCISCSSPPRRGSAWPGQSWDGRFSQLTSPPCQRNPQTECPHPSVCPHSTSPANYNTAINWRAGWCQKFWRGIICVVAFNTKYFRSL